MRHITHHLVITISVLLLAACASEQQQSAPPSSSPPSSSPPSSSPPSSSPPSSSPPSSSPSALPSPPSAPQQSSIPTSQPTLGQPSQPSSPSSDSTPSGDSDQKRQEAAEALKKAGQQIADRNEALNDTLPQDMRPGNEEWDPMMPDSDQVSDSESDTFMESESSSQSASSSESSASSSDPSTDIASSEAGGEAADDLMMPDMSDPSTADGEMMNDDLADDIRAAQEALAQAGIALQTAGTTLETATTDAELAEAEAALGKARLAVIIAGQDLMDIIGNPDLDIDPVSEDIFLETEEALNEANVAIVIATDSVFSTRLELPDFKPGSIGVGGAQGRQGELDKELNESIGIFEGKILDAREEVLGSAPPPSSSSNIPGVAILGGSPSGEQGDVAGGTLEENDEGLIEVGVPDVIQQGNMPDGGELARVEVEGATPPVPEDIPDPQGDDIVAQQLREAAIAESDPELRAKLWEEYKRYRAGL